MNKRRLKGNMLLHGYGTSERWADINWCEGSGIKIESLTYNRRADYYEISLTVTPEQKVNLLDYLASLSRKGGSVRV